jgi:hypothetical protein
LQPVVCGDICLVAFHHRLLRKALAVVKLEGVSLVVQPRRERDARSDDCSARKALVAGLGRDWRNDWRNSGALTAPIPLDDLAEG